MAKPKRRKKTRPAERKAQKREEESAKLELTLKLRDEVRDLYGEIKEEGTPIDREVLSVMAATEALSDVLVNAGLISRTDLNLSRFHHLKGYLEKIRIETNQEKAEATT